MKEQYFSPKTIYDSAYLGLMSGGALVGKGVAPIFKSSIDNPNLEELILGAIITIASFSYREKYRKNKK